MEKLIKLKELVKISFFFIIFIHFYGKSEIKVLKNMNSLANQYVLGSSFVVPCRHRAKDYMKIIFPSAVFISL